MDHGGAGVDRSAQRAHARWRTDFLVKKGLWKLRNDWRQLPPMDSLREFLNAADVRKTPLIG